MVLITGASRGIGAATARLFAARGYQVCINYRSNVYAANTVCDDICAAGGEAFVEQADVAEEMQVVALFNRLDARGGRLAVLVNNAGILAAQSRLEQLSADRIQTIFRTNVIGAMVCAREAVKRMQLSVGGQGGCIVNVSSMAALTGSPNEYIDYAASKGALDSFTRGLAKEVAGEGIRVNGVRPGLIYTDMHADGGEPNRVDRLRAKIPLGRGGTAVEVADAIEFLASDASRFCTGSILNVAGGYS
jgi:NAD(P)-dependent dehydrogenase (short-subunit alcohol dehydrogenase family)